MSERKRSMTMGITFGGGECGLGGIFPATCNALRKGIKTFLKGGGDRKEPATKGLKPGRPKPPCSMKEELGVPTGKSVRHDHDFRGGGSYGKGRLKSD